MIRRDPECAWKGNLWPVSLTFVSQARQTEGSMGGKRQRSSKAMVFFREAFKFRLWPVNQLHRSHMHANSRGMVEQFSCSVRVRIAMRLSKWWCANEGAKLQNPSAWRMRLGKRRGLSSLGWWSFSVLTAPDSHGFLSPLAGAHRVRRWAAIRIWGARLGNYRLLKQFRCPGLLRPR